ncbi:MAG: alanine racemase [Acidaminococcaceae bacterium]
MFLRNAWAEIDLDAIAHNIREAKKKISKSTKLCAVVKADAYGHGAVQVAQTALAAGADFLSVALLQEAIELRQAAIKAPILILGALQEECAEETVENEISQALFTIDSAKLLSATAVKLGKKAKVHLVIETGMNRIGISPEHAGEFAAEVSVLPGIEIEGIFSHFALADARDKTFCHEQYEKFEKAFSQIRARGIEIAIKHISNSATISELPEMQLNMVRQGITLYGLWPSDDVDRCLDYQPVMKLKTKVIFIKQIERGETVGYGRTFTAERPTKIATLPLGYADGISRKVSNKGYVLLKGKKAPIVGRICMDQFMIDITDIENVEIGDEVLVFGSKELSADKVAEWTETISYEVLCAVSKRIPRIYINR